MEGEEEEEEEEEWEMEEEEEEDGEDEGSAEAAGGSLEAGEEEEQRAENRGSAAPAWVLGAGAQGTQATARAAAAAALSSGCWNAMATKTCCKVNCRKFYVPGQCLALPSLIPVERPVPVSLWLGALSWIAVVPSCMQGL
jgi:hypothetical protein